ncbi:MAG: hypothetical protein ABEI80_08735 [Haloplanus sp.]
MRRPDTRSVEADDSSSERSRLGGVRRRLGLDFGLRSRIRGLFALRVFLLALVLSVAGLLVGGTVPLLGVVGRFVGIGVAGFLLAVLGPERRYVEAGLAGALAAGLGFVLAAVGSPFFVVLGDYGVQVAGVGTTAGLIAGLLGHYLGRDLRAGLTRDL